MDIDMRNLVLSFLLVFCKLGAQTPAPAVLPAGPSAAFTPYAFEVASVKPAAPLNRNMTAGAQIRLGMKIEGTRVQFGNMSLKSLVVMAYGLSDEQVSGPEWIMAARWDIVAQIPEGASRGQVPSMLQQLLADRFRLKLHREIADQDVYALLIDKAGPRLKEAPSDVETPASIGVSARGDNRTAGSITLGSRDGDVRMGADKQEGLVVTSGQGGSVRMVMTSPGIMHLESSRMTLSTLADILKSVTHRPVVDMTELTGTYELKLDFALDEAHMNNARVAASMLGASPAEAGSSMDGTPDPSGQTIFRAIRELGLRLEPRKRPTSVLVIDQVERTPTEN